MSERSNDPKARLEGLAREFASEEFRLQVAGANGRTAQLEAFCQLWAAGAAKARAARQISIGNFNTMNLVADGSNQARELENNIVSLIQHLMDMDQWFAMREMMLQQLLKAVQESEQKRSAEDVRH